MKTDLKVPYCMKCKDGRSGDAKFCFQCGSALVSGLRACECGYSYIWPHEKYCQECGKKVEEILAIAFEMTGQETR